MNQEIYEPRNFDCLQVKAKNLLYEMRDTAPFLHHFSLVGGSGLALYLCHRNSEDLDFFTFEDVFESREILNYCRRFPEFEILNEDHDQLDLLIDGVKTTFFNAKWSFLAPAKQDRLNISSLTAIAAMKIHVLFLRAKYRDYYDLYFLASKVMDLDELFICAQQVVPGLTYKLFCIALTYIDDIEDDQIAHLNPVEELSKEDIRAFFEQRIRQG